jgi:hypothetical protein
MQVVLPYIAEENRDEDPEVQVRPDGDGAAARAAKDAIFGARKEVRTALGALACACGGAWLSSSMCGGQGVVMGTARRPQLERLIHRTTVPSPPCLISSPRARSHRAVILQAIFPKIATLVNEFHAGKPAGHSASVADGAPVATAKTTVRDHKASDAPSALAKPQPSKGAGGNRAGRRIEMKETFYASARRSDFGPAAGIVLSMSMPAATPRSAS